MSLPTVTLPLEMVLSIALSVEHDIRQEGGATH
ncbi:Pyrrolidone-carboxylate peptidase [Erwinia tracheiphila PSU-1]|nr:Pyrrolidone-carboxylate peptidase [Erwinia tracheiphila PSU-1]